LFLLHRVIVNVLSESKTHVLVEGDGFSWAHGDLQLNFFELCEDDARVGLVV
jgi:hypothetical protein